MQVFLTHNFAFDLEASRSELKKRTAESQRTERIDFYFSLSQKHRLDTLQWIECGPGVTAGTVMEEVIAALTSKAKLGGARKARGEPRSWLSLSAPGCRGRLCPDTEKAEFENSISKADIEQDDFEVWLLTVTTAAVGTEINVQLGTFTLQSNQTELLDQRFVEAPEFESSIGMNGPQRLQCAKVRKTQQCEHVKLMFRHDLQYWEQDQRKPSVAFSYPNVALPEWISSGLRKLPEEYRTISTRFDNIDGDVVRGQFLHEGTLLEVVIFKTFGGTHINLFKVASYGRRFFRSLVFSSSELFCLHDLSPSLVIMDNNKYEVCCGKANLSHSLAPDRGFGAGLVVTRNLSADIGEQVYLPRRYLEGIIPSGLLGIQSWSTIILV